MGRQTRSNKPNNIGKGKVTPVQVAFIVDRYLSDNRFSETRNLFRSEASALIAKSPLCEAPKTLLSLGAMLNEYICLKEQKVMLEQERARLDQDKFRVQSLLKGMQDVMNNYNASAAAPVPAIQAAASAATTSVVMVSQSNPFGGSPAGCRTYNTPGVMPMLVSSNIRMEGANFPSPLTSESLARKRRGSDASLEVPHATRKSRSKKNAVTSTYKVTDQVPESRVAVTGKAKAQSSAVQSSTRDCAFDGSTVQVSSVAKCLFNQHSVSPPTNSTCPKTPPQAVSPQSDKSISPLGVSSTANCSNNNSPQLITPTNCTVISAERIRVSPSKQIACYTMERTHCISASPAKTNLMRLNKRDHVKGRLDFDGSDVRVSAAKSTNDEISTSESDKETDIFDIDLPNLDAFGENFSFSELLVELDLDSEGLGCPYPPTEGGPVDTAAGSSPESTDGNLAADQVVSEYSSTVTEVLSGKDMNSQGPDALTAVKSITKCIRILSPAKARRQ